MDIFLESGIVSASLQVVLDRFATFAHKKIRMLLGVDDELEKLERTVLKIQALLDDDAERSMINNAGRVWLQDLERASYDAEDLLDEISLGLLRLNLDESTHTNKNQVRNMVVSSFNFSIPNEINKMQEILEDIATEMDSLFLSKLVKLRQSTIMRRPPHCTTSSLIDELSVIGRDNDKNEIIQMLLSEKSGVIPIVGMGGLGKTTLAQIVYNDERVVSWFDLRMWVHVSVEFDAIRITRSILESFMEKNCKLSDLDPMQVRLQNALKGKKFLLVLDDMWNENFSDWDVLLSPFRVGSIGSKILVTTRSTIVSSIVGTTPPHYLPGLSDEDCWALIKQRALAKRGNLDEHQNLIGEEIARKCKGLPLVAKTLGSVLHFKLDEEEWDAILKNELWDLPEDKNEIFPALRLSYHHLPTHLKKCFAYCSIFPQNFEFEKDYLVQLWMAEGFIQPKGRRRMEDIGSNYFDNLLWRSFFQDSRVNVHDPAIYKMHDLIHNLAQLVSVDICFRKEDDISHSYPMLRNARHSSLLRENVQRMNLEAFFCKYESLRTLLLFGHRTHIGQVHCNLFLKLRRLRVLDLSYTGIVELPDSIDNLKHLRYLNVSGTLIRKLPESTANLCGLQTLKLKECGKFLQLPKNSSNLTSLRHLHLDQNGQLSSMPSDLGKLTRLQTLNAFIVGSDRGCRIRELKDMRDLRGSISITKLENVENGTEAKEAMLDKKPKLNKIELQWDKSEDRTASGDILAGLKPHENLKELHIKGYVGFLFPTWLGDPSLRKLKTLYLQGCECKVLPPLGQLPLLKSLHIEEMSGLKNVDHFFCGVGVIKSFPSLEFLEFCNLPKLEEWSGLNANDMPCLRQLSIVDCPDLISLPSLHYLTSLEHLEISRCPILLSLPAEGLPISLQALIINESSILQERCRARGEDWWMIRPILTLEIDYVEIPVQG